MKIFQALRSPAIPLTSFHDLLGFPFHAKEVTSYIRPFTLHFIFFNNSISGVQVISLQHPISVMGLPSKQADFLSGKITETTSGNRTRDLTACSAVPQPTAPPRAYRS